MRSHAQSELRSCLSVAFLLTTSATALTSAQTCALPCQPWVVRSFGCDVGNCNCYRLERDGTPICGSGNCPGAPGSCWGPSQVGVAILDSHGSIRMNQGNDYQVYGHTYLYTPRAVTLVASFSADVGRVWLNNQEVTAAPLTLNLVRGDNHLEFTSYNQNQGTSLTIGFPGVRGVVIGSNPHPHCPADLDDGSGDGTPDAGVTIEDLNFFLDRFAAGNLGADLDDGSGTGTPDGGLTIDDLLYFLERYAAGC